MFSSLSDFIQESDKLFIYCAYIKLEPLKKLIQNNTFKVKSVCVRWSKKDLLLGSSDIELYPYLKQNGICLYINPRLHAKVFIDNNERCFIGSNNLSARALNIPESKLYNYEIATIVPEMSLEDKVYFFSIQNDSILVTDDIYFQIKQQLVGETKIDDLKKTFSINNSPNRDFLISSLPLTWSVCDFFDFYYGNKRYGEIEGNCFAHDLALYNIPLGLSDQNLIRLLKRNFFSHPFISGFLNELHFNDGLFFGEIKSWIYNNCTDVPIPRKGEITENIQILYNWIIELGGGKYYISKPNYSEKLCVK